MVCSKRMARRRCMVQLLICLALIAGCAPAPRPPEPAPAGRAPAPAAASQAAAASPPTIPPSGAAEVAPRIDSAALAVEPEPPAPIPPLPPGVSVVTETALPASALAAATPGPGWHLLSFPQQPASSDPAAVLSSVAGRFSEVFAYRGCDASDPWKQYTPGGPPAANDLTALDHTTGFWINIDDPIALSVAGDIPQRTVFQLCQGWNLVGFPAGQSRPLPAALASIAGKYSHIFAYNPADSSDPWEIYDVSVPGWANDLPEMAPGRGFWIYALESAELVLTASSPPPVADLLTPTDLFTVTAPIIVTGTASSPDLALWEVEYRLSGEPAWAPLVSGTNLVDASALGSFDPSLLLNGIYELRLSVIDTSGQVATDAVNVVVEGDLKVGHFTLSWVDLEVPLAGIPIQIIRTYDSRDKRSGDFGYGWTLSIKDVRVQEDGRLGVGWEAYIEPGLFTQYCLRQTKPHLVMVTLPDGEVLKFRAVSEPSCDIFDRIRAVTISYEPLPGTNAQLLNTEFAVVQGPINGPVTLFGPDPENPLDPGGYQVELPDGRVLDLIQGEGLRSITDLNGNQIQITPNGIFHSSGAVVEFQRDEQRRITRIIDPAGASLGYAYDARGDLRVVTDRDASTTKFTYNRSHGLLTIEDQRGIVPLRNEYDDSGRLLRHIDADGKVIVYDRDIAGRREAVKDRFGHTTTYFYDDRGNVLSQVDALGNTTRYTYDTHDNKLSETDALGRTTRYSYDGLDNLLTMTDALGRTTTNTYNARSQLLTSTDPDGDVAANSYDLKGNLLSSRDALGNTTSYTYDRQGLPTSMTDALGNTTRYSYDSFGNLTVETDALGNTTNHTYDTNNRRVSQNVTRSTPAGAETLTTSYGYDAKGRITQTTYPNGTTTRTTYDAAGRETVATNQRGHQTSYEYDAQGRLVRTLHPDQTSSTSTYDANGNLVASTDRGGRTTRFLYDALNRQIETIYPDGASLRQSYDAAGQLIGTLDARGNPTSYSYDAVGNRLRMRDAIGNVTSYVYDTDGNQTAVTDARGNTTRYEYDAAGQLTRTVFPDGTSETTAYDAIGRSVARTDQAGLSTRYAYDALGRLTAVTDALGQVTRYSYDEQGNQLTQTDANGNTTRYGYDSLGRRISRTLPLGQTETYAYDQAGNLTAKVDFNGLTTTYSYDAENRLASRSGGGSFVGFEYTPTGRRAAMSDGATSQRYYYDSRDRLVRKSVQWTTGGTGLFMELNYSYDAAGNVTSVNATNLQAGVNGGASVAYTYDALNRLSSVADNSNGGVSTTYSYDPVGNLAGYSTPNGVSTSYTFDRLNRLTQVQIARGQSALARYRYTLGPAGNRLSVEELSGRTASYSYDSLYRLTAETIADDPLAISNGSVGYRYDPGGNRLARSSTLAAVDTASYSYDANDRLAADQYDANGNTTAAGGASYSYNFENRLVGLNGGQVAYYYDGDGNRVAKTEGGVTTYFLVDSLNPTGYAQVLDEISQGAVQRSYLYGLDLVSQRQRDAQGWATHYYGYDGHGSTRLLTDAAGAVSDTYTYDAFGALTAATGTTPNLYRYAGEQLDPNLGFYYLRARYMSPEAGRFWTKDTFAGHIRDPLSLHKYLYTHANPINNLDPSGQESLGSISAGSIGTNSIATSAAPNFTLFILRARLVSVSTGGVGYIISRGPNALQSLRNSGMMGIEALQRMFVQLREPVSLIQARGAPTWSRVDFNTLIGGRSTNIANIQWHHIVTQAGGRNIDKFYKQAIDSVLNVVPIAKNTHTIITNFYSSPIPRGVRVETIQQWMERQPWEVQYNAGIEILRQALQKGSITWMPPW